MEIRNNLAKFIEFIENTSTGSEDEKINKLENELIDLYKLCLNLEAKQSKDLKKNFKHDEIYAIVGKNFPSFGYYNDTLEINDNIGESEHIVGDAVDDLTDIIISLKESLSFSKEKDVIGHLKLNFEFHIKEHIINLLRYINSK
jgi:flagellin-specific chaperone FliS